jgi:hypothetical protein
MQSKVDVDEKREASKPSKRNGDTGETREGERIST